MNTASSVCCRSDIEANRLPTRVTSHAERRAAVADANYVVSCVRIGGLPAFAHDIEIPLKYGVDQCVGDTICAGGIMYGQRSIPATLEFCRDIREVAADGACHGVQNGWRQIADALGAARPEEVDYICSGINHQTWYVDIRFRGRRIGAEELANALATHPKYRDTEKVRIDVLRRFGAYSTESNGHLSEYLPWYRKRPDEINRWIDLSNWINGETGGYLRVCTERRDWFTTDFPRWLSEAGSPLSEYVRTDEHFSHIVEALETGRVYRGHFNVKNTGLVTNLPSDCIVETPGFVDRFGLNMVAGITLPLGCAATCTS